MRLLTERKGLQRVLFVGVDGTNGAVKLQRGRISKGDQWLLSCCFETGASPNTFLRLFEKGPNYFLAQIAFPDGSDFLKRLKTELIS